MKRTSIAAITVIALGIILELLLSATGHIFYNILLLPLIGAASCVLLHKNSWIAFVVVFAVSLVCGAVFEYKYGAAVDSDFFEYVFSGLLYAIAFAILCMLGALAALLLSFAFKRGNEKKKAFNVLAVLGALLIIAAVLYFANLFVGNPVSKMIARNSAEDFISENYSDGEFVIESISYDSNLMLYDVEVKSSSNADKDFTILVYGNGEICNYEEIKAN